MSRGLSVCPMKTLPATARLSVPDRRRVRRISQANPRMKSGRMPAWWSSALNALKNTMVGRSRKAKFSRLTSTWPSMPKLPSRKSVPRSV